MKLRTETLFLVVGFIIFAAGAGIIIYYMSAADGENNSLTFEGKVQAQITDQKIIERTKNRKKKGGAGYYTIAEGRDYVIEFLVTIGSGTYEERQDVSKSVYDKYSVLEKNKDMEWNLYRNPDGASFLSMEDLEGARTEYHDVGYVTEDMAIRMIAGMVTAFIGWGVMIGGANARKKAKLRAAG